MRALAAIDVSALTRTDAGTLLHTGKVMRVLALDYGRARCGCAVSDPTGVLASPIESVHGPTTRRGLARLRTLVRELEVETVVVGLPLSLSGRDSAQTARRARSRRGWSDELPVPVELYDERFTTRSGRADRGTGGRGLARGRAPAWRAGWPASQARGRLGSGRHRCLTATSAPPTDREQARRERERGRNGDPRTRRPTRRAPGSQASATAPSRCVATTAALRAGRILALLILALAGGRGLVPGRALPTVPRLAARPGHGHDPGRTRPASQIGDDLANDGVISSSFFFELRATLDGERGDLRVRAPTTSSRG